MNPVNQQIDVVKWIKKDIRSHYKAENAIRIQGLLDYFDKIEDLLISIKKTKQYLIYNPK